MKKMKLLRLAVAPVVYAGLTLAFAGNGFAQTDTGISMPVVTIRVPDPSASESGDPGLFRVFRDGPTNNALSVFLLIEGPASNGVDYATIPNWIPIPAGVRAVEVPVLPIDDILVEGTEAVALRLVYPPILAPLTYLIGNPSNAVVAIADNDRDATNRPPVVGLVFPTNGSAFVAPADIPMIADARDADGYVATVEFFEGANSLGIMTNNPLVVSPINPFYLVWSNVPPGSYILRARATDNDGAVSVSAPVNIAVRPEPPPPVVNIVAVDPEASEIPPVPPGMGMPQRIDPAAFKVWRNGATNLALDVFYSVGGTASNGVDYERLSGMVTIPAGAFATHIEVLPIDDLLVEGRESVLVRLEPAACVTIYPPPPGCYQVGPTNRAEACILDNDFPTNLPPAVHVVRPMDGQMFSAPADVKIVADTVDADGYVNHVEYYEGTRKIGEETRNFFVPPPPGQHIAYEFLWTNVPPGRYELRVKATDDQNASTLSAPVCVWVLDTNLPPVTNLPPISITATDPIASEGTNCVWWPGWSGSAITNCCFTNTATFVVRRHGDTNTDLTVEYNIGGTASNGVDYLALPGTITIPAGQRKAPIVVVPIDDSLPERVETVVLALRLPVDSPTNMLPPCTVRWPWKAAAVIVDNDQPRPVTSALPDRCFHIMRPGANGQWFRIECSTNMVHWTALCTNVVTDGALHFVDPEAEDSPSRFYRAVPETNPPQD